MREPHEHEIDALVARALMGEPHDGACIDDGVLIAYRAGGLSEDRARGVEQHLVGCGECRVLLTELGRPVPAKMEQWAQGAVTASTRRGFLLNRAGLLAMAATALLATSFGLSLIRAAVPEYEAEVLGAVRYERGAAVSEGGERSAARTFAPDSQIRLVLRPSSLSPCTPDLALTVSVEGEDGVLRPAPAGKITQGDGGTFRFEATARDLLGARPGLHRIHLEVRPRDALHTTPRELVIEVILASSGPL